MTKIYCTDADCRFRNKEGVCTEDVVAMGQRRVVTQLDGQQKFHDCKTKQITFKAFEENLKRDPLRGWELW